MFPLIKAIFKRGKPVSKGPIVQTMVFVFQEEKWRKVKPDCTKHNIANKCEEIFDFFSGKYIIVPKEVKNGQCRYKNPYYLELTINKITEKELKALKLKIQGRTFKIIKGGDQIE